MSLSTKETIKWERRIHEETHALARREREREERPTLSPSCRHSKCPSMAFYCLRYSMETSNNGELDFFGGAE